MNLPIILLLAIGASSAQAQPADATGRTTADAVREALRRVNVPPIDSMPAHPRATAGAPETSIVTTIIRIVPVAQATVSPPPAAGMEPAAPLTSATPSTPVSAPAPVRPLAEITVHPAAPVQPRSTEPVSVTTIGASATRLATDGAINVSTDPPGAEVVLDGRLVGATPLFLRNLLPGEHELELLRSGASLRRRRIRIAAGKVLNLRLPGLLPGLPAPVTTKTGSLVVEVEPRGTSVYLPGRKPLGRTPLTTELAPGFYVITLEAAGRQAEEREVRIDRGTETRIEADLSLKQDLVDVFRKRRRDRERDLFLSESRRLQKAGDYNLALERTRQALALDPTSIPAYEALARIYERLGDKAGAAEAAAKAKALSPSKD